MLDLRSVASLTQQVSNGHALLDLTTHEAREGALQAALDEIESLDETRGRPTVYRVVGGS